jgi:hypothetical protein
VQLKHQSVHPNLDLWDLVRQRRLWIQTFALGILE